MSYTVQAAEPNASATARGVLTTGAQTIGGVKTFANKVVIASQGGGGANALEFSANLEYIRWPTAGGDCLVGGWNIGGEPVLYLPNGPIRTQSGSGFIMGGINSSLSASGVSASGNSHLVDLIQGQAAQKIAVLSAKGASAGAVVKVGSTAAAVDPLAELLRVGFNMAGGAGSDGTACFRVFGDGAATLLGALTALSYSAPGFSVISGNMSVGQITNAGLIVSTSTAVQEVTGQVADGAAAIAVAISPFAGAPWTQGKLAVFRNNRAGTEKLAVHASGKLIWPTGTADAVAGVATLVAGTVTVNTTSVKTGSVVHVSRKTTGGAVGHLSVVIVDSTSLTINSSSGTETSSVSWSIAN